MTYETYTGSRREMQDKDVVNGLVLSYIETRKQADFLEILRRLRPMIRSRSRKAGIKLDQQAIEQISALAIVNAIETFDPAKGSFAAYALQFVICEMRNEKCLSLATTPPKNAERRYIVNHAPRQISVEMSNGATYTQAVSMAAVHFGSTVRDIESCLAMNSPAQQIDYEKDCGAEISDHRFENEKSRIIERSMRDLTHAERIIVSNAFLTENRKTVPVIAAEVGFCERTVNKKLHRAIEKMRSFFEGEGLTASDVL